MSSDAVALAERLERVRADVREAVRAAGRGDDEVTTIVVTKFHPAQLIRDLHELGVRDFGENRHQEAQQKAVEVSELDLDWHFVGQLQSKKARAVRAYARFVHSLDRPSLVSALSDGPASGLRTAADGDAAEQLSCFIQVNLSGENHRGGVAEADLPRFAEEVAGVPSLRLAGVMGVAPLGEEPGRAFARLRGCSELVRAVAPGAVAISAGMSADFREAVAEGATHLRIGSAITGIRPAAG